MRVDDDVAVVGEHALAVDRVSAQLQQFAAHVAARHGDDLDGQREGAEARDELALVGDAHELPRYRRHDLLARERATAAFHQFERAVRLVRAIDVDVHAVQGVQIEDRYAVRAKPLCRGFRTRDRGLDLCADARQKVNEAVGGGARADADHGLVAHARAYVVEGGFCDVLLEFRLRFHRALPAWTAIARA